MLKELSQRLHYTKKSAAQGQKQYRAKGMQIHREWRNKFQANVWGWKGTPSQGKGEKRLKWEIYDTVMWKTKYTDFCFSSN